MSDIGLDCSINPGLKVFGVFKHLWEDFHVREIQRDGTVLQLSRLQDQDSIRAAHVEGLEVEAGGETLKSGFKVSEEDAQRIRSECHLDEQAIKTLETFVLSAIRIKEHLQAKSENGQIPSSLQDSAFKALSQSHGLILPPTNLSAAESKIARKAMHEVIRDLYPFLETETGVTSDVYDNQGKPEIPADLTQDLEDECADAASLQCVYEPKELIEAIGLTPVTHEKMLGQMLALDYAALKASVKDTSSGEDLIKFLTIKLKKVAIFGILGRPLLSAPNSKDSNLKWNKTLPPYLHFTVQKQNRDGPEVVKMITSALGMREKYLSYAGTKDKRGCTVQRMSLAKVTKGRLLTCSTYRSWDRGVKISDLEYNNRRVCLGDLAGNHFTLAIRRIPASLIRASADDQPPQDEAAAAAAGRQAVAEHIAQLVKSLQENGFINYYGNQRFGTRRIRTWQVGAALFRREYLDAIQLILRAAIELPEVPEGQERDWSEVERKLRPNHFAEKTLVKSLMEAPKNYCGALQKIQKNSLALYYHAVQSLIWNKLASERFTKFGLKIVVGDVVILPLSPAPEREDVEVQEPDQDAQEGQDDEEAVLNVDDDQEDRVTTFKVKLIETEEEASQFKIEDLCLPIVGPGIIFPTNLTDKLNELCQEYLNQAITDVNEESWKTHLVGLEGSYRRVVIKPANVAHKILHDVSEKKAVLASDVDRLLGRPIAQEDDFIIGLKPLTQQITIQEPKENAKAEMSETTTQAADSNEPVPENQDAEAPAPEQAAVSDVLLFSCSLPKSSYLTCLLRELLDEGSITELMAPKEHKFFKNSDQGGGRQWKRGPPKRGGGPNKRRR